MRVHFLQHEVQLEIILYIYIYIHIVDGEKCSRANVKQVLQNGDI